MPSINDLLVDEAIRHQVQLAQYSNSVVRKIIAVLNRSDSRLYAELTAALERLDPSSFTVERLESLLGSVRAINSQAYSQLGLELRSELRNFVSYEVAYQQAVIQTATPVQFHTASVSAEQVYAAALSRPFQGVVLQGALADMEVKKARLIRQTVAQGFVEGRTTGQIVRSIRGTRARGYADGITEITRRDAEAIARTALHHMAGFVQDRVTEANADIIKAVQWLSTLDLRTSPICRVRDGKLYKPVTHKPMGHELPWLGGPGRAHWRCRSAQTYVLKSNKELGIDLPEVEFKSTRASMDGQVPDGVTYPEWLKKQSAKRQDEVLGPDRGALFRTGKLPLESMYSQAGKYLTLDELKAQDAGPFKKAGLENPIKPPPGVRKDAIATFLDDSSQQQALLQRLYTGQGLSFDGNMAKVRAIKSAEGYGASDESLGAVRYYTGSGYKPINKRMREGGFTLEDRQFTALTAKGVEDLPAYRGEVWRAPSKTLSNADGWWDKAIVGSDLDVGNQLQSFSSKRQIAAQWASGGDVIFHIRKPRAGAYIEKLSLNPGESEVLIPPGLRYIVESKRTEVIQVPGRGARTFRIIELKIVE